MQYVYISDNYAYTINQLSRLLSDQDAMSEGRLYGVVGNHLVPVIWSSESSGDNEYICVAVTLRVNDHKDTVYYTVDGSA